VSAAHAAGVTAVSDDYYPIFINWQSSLSSSYKDRLTKVRKGRVRPLVARASAPYALVEDLVGGAVSVVPDTVELIFNSVTRGAGRLSCEKVGSGNRMDLSDALADGYRGVEDFQVGCDKRSQSSKF